MRWVKELGGWIGSIILAFVFAVLIGVFVVQPTKVLGHSMDPTLHENERLFISKLVRTFSSEPDYGDIVIIDSRVDRKRSWKDNFQESPLLQWLDKQPDDRSVWVKRVIGMPGDVIEFKDNQVYRNDQPIEEPYVKETMSYRSSKRWVVPEGHIFVLGDNRNHSSDSRDIGFVPFNHILGKKI